jgi:LysR family glycine cleavage system transcriptional activator
LQPGFYEKAAPITGLEDFARQPLIQDSHQLWYTLFEEDDIKVHRRMIQFNQTALAMDAAANGQGIALAPRLLVDADILKGRLAELWQDPGSNQGGYYVIYPNNRKSNLSLETVVDWALS